MSKKKYGLKCFGCGAQFFSKDEVFRQGGKPYCGECIAGWADAEHDEFLEKQWHEEHPNWTEQDEIDQANINRYGEC